MAGLIMVNDIRVVRSMTLAGEGVALLPVCLCREACAEKLLVPVLPEWHSRSGPIHLVYPHQRFIPPKLRVFVDLAVPELRQWLAVF
jgi:DNA-binding transcriptional LysR family regulator